MESPKVRALAQLPILLPKSDEVDMTKWAVVACDQYAAQPEYWHDVQCIVGGSHPSTLHLMLPEAFLSRKEEEIPKINARMREYLSSGIFEEHKGIVFVKREVGGVVRYGVLLSMDLEEYSFEEGSSTIIRATERTVEANLPPRVMIRSGAALEMPHILVLIDDPSNNVLGPLIEQASSHQTIPSVCEGAARHLTGMKLLYDFRLMKESGHITGWELDSATSEGILKRLEHLSDPSELKAKYPSLPHGTSPLIYALGDGNHSFAAAKVIWERIKEQYRKDHPELPQSAIPPDDPRRYVLAEIENIHDPGIAFEPIHRVLLGVNPEKTCVCSFLKEQLLSKFEARDSESSMALIDWREDEYSDVDSLAKAVQYMNAYGDDEGKPKPEAKRQAWGYILPGPKFIRVSINALPQCCGPIVYSTLQPLLDQYIVKGNAETIEYVHGAESALEVCQHHTKTFSQCDPDNPAAQTAIGIIMPSIPKDGFFQAVMLSGVLPRKSFSMGEAESKRFYLECRRIE